MAAENRAEASPKVFRFSLGDRERKRKGFSLSGQEQCMPEDIVMIAARNLRQQRTRLGLTQKEVARLMGVGVETVCRMEKGHHSTSLKRLQQFADLYGCTVIDLLRPEADLLQEPTTFAAQLQRLSARERTALRNFLKASIHLLHD